MVALPPDPHIVALQTLLAATGKTVYTVRAPSGAAYPYIVLEPGQGLASTTSLEGSSDQRFCRFVTRYFSTVDWHGVDNLRSHTRLAVLDVRPSVVGRSSGRIHHETEFPMDRDEDMPDVVIFSGDSWTFSTRPA